MDIFGIYWAGIDRIIFFPIFLIFFILSIKNYQRIKNLFSQLIHTENRRIILKNFSLKKQFLKTFLFSLSLLFLFLALLQPQWGKKEQTIVQEGRDLFILLDISRSMIAEDLKPNRLDFAKLKIRTLLEKLPCERVGLILFSGSAFLQCPLTIDHSSFLMFLDQAGPETISSGTTAIDNALQKAMSAFESSAGRKNKLAVLITDGEDFSLQLESVKQKALEQNIKLFALGVGTPDGAPIPILDNTGKQVGHETDSSGKVEMSKLNEPMLQDICKNLNGTYLRASYDDSDLDTLSGIVKSFEKEKFMDKKFSLYEEQYPWFLGVALLLLLLEWLL